MEGMKAAKLNRRMKKFITRPQDGGALLPAFLPSDRHSSRKINNARSGSRSKEKSEPSQRDQGVPVFFRDPVVTHTFEYKLDNFNDKGNIIYSKSFLMYKVDKAISIYI